MSVYSDMLSPELLISREALAHNVGFLKRKTTSSFMCPMVKANAYGVGDSLVVGELLNLGIKNFGVVRVFEGQRLRRLYPQKEFNILVFAPLCVAHLEEYISSNLTPVVGSFEDLKYLEALSLKEKEALGGVHIKFDLGMARLGFEIKEAQSVKDHLKKMSIKVIGICGHFSQADQISVPGSKDFEGLRGLSELSKFFELELGLDAVHAPNSVALGLGSFEIGSRPGISLYGLSDEEEVSKNLKPALSLKAPLVYVRQVKAGTKVSYDGLWQSLKDTTLGVLFIGYADGLPRGLSGKIDVEFEGESFPQVGLICMDYTMVDLGPNSCLKARDQLTLFGESHNHRALSQWASSLGCLTHELLVGLGDRLRRRIV